MMKWKVVKNPRSSSADRSLECLRNDVQNNVNNNNNCPQINNCNSDTNNNVGEEDKQLNSPPVVKETNRQRESSLSRKTAECINLKSILGLARQRSETNLSVLGLVCSEGPRRSRSEVRGASCDRLTVGYHTGLNSGKTRSSSPQSRSGWLRGRKREREFRSPIRAQDGPSLGKTVVAGSNRKRTNSRSRNGDCRTIVDGASNGLSPAPRSSLDPRKCKSGRKSSEEDIIEEEIYTEINSCEKLLDDNRDVPFRDPSRVVRKKGVAPKPQVTTAPLKDNLNPNIRKDCEAPPRNHKLHRRNQTYNGRNQDRRPENRMMQTVKLNNLKNMEKSLAKGNINAQSIVAVAEVHKQVNDRNLLPEHESIKVERLAPSKEPVDEQLPFHIDTPDYSTLDSVNCNSFSMSTEDLTFSKDDATFSKEDVANGNNNNSNTDCDESLQESSDCPKVNREISLSSILRDSSNETREPEPKKTVRFQKLDLIEKYKKGKTENSMDVEEDADLEPKLLMKKVLDVNSNEVSENLNPQVETTVKSNCMTVNVLVRNPSPVPQLTEDGCLEETPPQFVVKKSFVLTVAKQEKGFRSLCANKKLPEAPEPPKEPQQQISVTFLCSGPPSEGWVLPSEEDHQRLRSTSVPPRSLQTAEVMRELPTAAVRGRSRDRRSKERQHYRKSHKVKKKEAAVFAMPQAVIDELSQVLEKRKPSLDEIVVHP